MNAAHRPCLAVAMALGLGIVAGKFAPVPLWMWFVPAVGGFIYLCLASRRILSVLIIYGLSFCLGAVLIQQRYLLSISSIAFLGEPEAAEVQAIEGMVDSDPGPTVRTGRTFFLLQTSRVSIGNSWRPGSGKVQVNWHAEPEALPQYGDQLRVQGRLRPIFDGRGAGGFSYRRYMQEQGVYWTIAVAKAGACVQIGRGGNIAVRWAIAVRRQMTAIFYQYLAPREAGFVTAIVLGDRTGMPKDLNQIFVNTGTAHILAISGMNMTIISAIIFFVLRLWPLPRWMPFAGTILFLLAYAFLSGWSASVVRACLMSSVMLAGYACEYEGDALNSLGVAALILLLLDPRNLFDVGFQLSFGAVAGILLLHKWCAIPFRALPLFVRTSMAVSLAAWAGTALTTFIHFHMITPISILANIPIVPLADLTMALGLGLAAAGGWCAPLGYAFAGCLKAALSAMIICAAWFNQVPYGHFIF